MDRFLIVIGRTGTGYSAHSPDLPGCVAVGKTVEKVIKRMKEAIALHLEGMSEDGEEIPQSNLDAWRAAMEDADSDQYLFAWVQINTQGLLKSVAPA